MSDIGIFLLLFACLLIAVGLIRFFSWLTELQEKHGSVTRAGVNTVKRYVMVERPVMSRPIVQTEPYEGRTERTNERSPHQIIWDAFLLDKTRIRLIELMVDSDLTTTDIRALLKGESKTIGEEVEAARLRLGKTAPDQYRTPIAGRPTNAVYYDQEPELHYEMPPN